MTRRKKSVLFLRISCTMPKRPISSFATFSASFSEHFPAAALHCKVTSQHHLGTTSHIHTSSDLLQNLPEKRLLLPLTLSSFLPLPRRIFQNLLCLCPFESEMRPHSTYKLLVSCNCSHCSTMCFLFHDCSPLPRIQARLTLLHHLLVVALLTQINCVGFSTFFNHHRRKPPVSDRFFAATIVAETNGSSWLATGTRRKRLIPVLLPD